MTQLECAKKGVLTRLAKQTAASEHLEPKIVAGRIKDGTVVLPANRVHALARPCAIGLGLRTKVNANIGTSPDRPRLDLELKKLHTAVHYGADTVMDLSVGGDLPRIRRAIMQRCGVPVGTVPIYEVAVRAQRTKGDFLSFDIRDILTVLADQAKDGVDFFTIHAGVTRGSLSVLKKHKRILGIVSRGGAILAAWMKKHSAENPFYEYFEDILDIAHDFDVTLSLGDGLRPGSILDATDAAQLSELKILGALAGRCRLRGVQVMIEGPGHVPLDQIKKNIDLEKKWCRRAPFYVLGPLVTDCAPGYDHITGAIGAALAASYGADFLCYVTAAEHLRHPSDSDVREGVIASRIAAHAADVAKGMPEAIAMDRAISQARSRRDWKKQIRLSLDPDKAAAYRASSKPSVSDVCTMCGQYCSIKVSERCLG